MTRLMTKALLMFVLAAMFSGTQALATGWHHPPQDRDCDIELPDCYWSVDFKVEYRSSYYYGQLFYVDDNVTGSGYELLGVDPSHLIGSKAGLLGIEFNFKGKTFDQCDDILYDKTPLIKFKNGQFVGLQFAFKDGGDLYRITLDKFYKGYYKKGYVKYESPEYHCHVIPTPAAASAGLALMGLLGLRRRRTA